MIFDFEQLKKQNKNGFKTESRISNLEGKVNAILTLTIVEFIGFIGLTITLITKI